jgi:hypothetical protein
MGKSWTGFEDRVRDFASYIWGHECKPAHIGGVDIDGVISLDTDLSIFIEITERKDLAKVREDVIKLKTAKNALLSTTGAFARCYCVINGGVTQAMVEAGAPDQIKILFFDNFSKIFFDFGSYRTARENTSFGSAVKPLTGETDDNAFINVKYRIDNSSKELSTTDIVGLLNASKRIVLLGEYGTGKSRCSREVFREMALDASSTNNYPIAIDLRESWGLKRGAELIRRHLEDLGADQLQTAAIRALASGTLTLLLDGFDELGSQAWSNDSEKLRAIRARSLEGLICQTITDLSDDELDEMFGVGDNEFQFFDHFIRVLCERDARIHGSFDAATIETVLTHLARLTRSRPTNVGPISLADVQRAFEAVVGQMPVEDAAVMLQRLPALGRVKAESNDRQFIDVYISDGLRAKDTAKVVRSDDNIARGLSFVSFINPLDDLGQRILAYNIDDRTKEAVQFAKRCLKNGNRVLACDIIAAILRMNLGSFDFGGLSVVDGHFVKLDMSETLPIGLDIKDWVFGSLILPKAPPPGTRIDHSLAERVYGVGGAGGLPKWITNLDVHTFDSVESVSRIRQIGLDARHEILVTIVRKTFFQKGAGRKEEALLRGLDQRAAPAVSTRIVNLLLKNDVIRRFKGDEGWVYTPNRAFAGRMKTMIYELKVSQVPIWMEVGGL